MDPETGQSFPEVREGVRKLVARFPGPYWQALDRERRYPTEFVTALTEAGWLSVLIPEEYGGSGLGLTAAAAVLEEIHRSGCNGGACHAQMYVMGTILNHGSAAQKAEYLPRIAVIPRSPASRLSNRRRRHSVLDQTGLDGVLEEHRHGP